MKRILIAFSTVLLAFSAQSQNLLPANITCNKPAIAKKTTHHHAKSTSCTDDVTYLYAKATSFTGIQLNNVSSAKSMAQYFSAGQTIQITGFKFYVYQDSTVTMPVIARIYKAAADSLPTGLPLRTDTVLINPGTQPITSAQYQATFDSALTTNQPYVLVVTNNSATSVIIYTSNYSSNDGQGEWLCSGAIGAGWYRSYNINVGGVPFDADAIMEPLISYTPVAKFTMDKACADNNGDTVIFHPTSPLMSTRMYNQSVFHKIKNAVWNYDDGTPADTSVDDTMHIYANSGTYFPYLIQTITAWNGCTASASDTEKVFSATPTAAFTFTNVGMNYNFTDQSTNATSWKWFFGDGDSSAIQNPNHTYASAGYKLVQLFVENGCGISATAQNIQILSIEKYADNIGISVGPNPTNGIVRLNFKKQTKAEIFIRDISGRIVKQEEINTANVAINLSSLEDAVYNLEVKTKDGKKANYRIVLSK